jgi:hypothetical protein
MDIAEAEIGGGAATASDDMEEADGSASLVHGAAGGSSVLGSGSMDGGAVALAREAAMLREALVRIVCGEAQTTGIESPASSTACHTPRPSTLRLICPPHSPAGGCARGGRAPAFCVSRPRRARIPPPCRQPRLSGRL